MQEKTNKLTTCQGQTRSGWSTLQVQVQKRFKNKFVEVLALEEQRSAA